MTAKAVGLSWPTYTKAKKVVAAAREDDEFQPLVEQMDRTGNVTRALTGAPPAPAAGPRWPRAYSPLLRM